MIFKKVTAWITDADGFELPEYQTKVIDANTIEYVANRVGGLVGLTFFPWKVLDSLDRRNKLQNSLEV